MDEVMKKVNDESIFLRDLRSNEEYEAGHIVGALFVPMAELDVFMRDLPHHAEVIACRSTSNSSIALYSGAA
ncbi:rhodanese-like domain-containing protein [Cohnella sp. GCM10012308]|uniref:rhodanese-like domain-containing protein n=1 Tax=Cohnella sp. GCM10012308 TaxID=3317329 RepID=UPI003613865F